MPSVPFLATNLFASGPTGSVPSVKAGPEGGFALALSAAENGLNGAGVQARMPGDGQNQGLSNESLLVIDGGASSTGPVVWQDMDTLQELGESINGSVGAANLLIHFSQWSATETGLAVSSALGKELPPQSAVAQMLAAIASADKVSAGGDLQPGANVSVADARATVQEQTGAFRLNGWEAEQAEIQAPQVPAQVAVTSVSVGTTSLLQTLSGTENTTSKPTTVGEMGTSVTTPPPALPASEVVQPGAQLNETRRVSAQPEVIVQGGKATFQNENSQVLVSSQAVNSEQSLETSTTTAGTGVSVETAGPRQEINASYIRSHLPNNVEATAQENSFDQDQNNAGSERNTGNGADTAGQATTAQLLTQRASLTGSQAETPLLFAHHLESSQLATTGSGSATTADPSMMRLPSGTLVPEGAAMDQMITHLSMNRRLETGAINLKLHPQELGELRMEIKVEQDNIKAHIIAQSPQAQEMIDRHLPRLREALEQQGLHLTQVEVTVAAQDNSDSQRFQDNLSHNLMHRSQKNGTTASTFPLGVNDEPEETAPAPSNLSVMA